MKKKSNVDQFINIVNSWRQLSDDELRSEMYGPLIKYFEEKLKNVEEKDSAQDLKDIFDDIQYFSNLRLGSDLNLSGLGVWDKIKNMPYEMAIKKHTDLPILRSF